MATATTNASIRPVLARIKDILDDYLDAGDVLNPTGTTRPVKLIEVGWPVAQLVHVNELPAVYIHMDSMEPTDEWTGAQMHSMTVTLSLIENILDKSTSLDVVNDYVDELLSLVYKTHRKWKRAADSDLGIATTQPGGVTISPFDAADDHFLIQADITMLVQRQFDFY